MTFILAASIAFGLLAIHPFTVFPATLWVLRRFRPRPLAPAAAAPDSFAVCFCAYNEEGVIERKAENMRALKRGAPSVQLLAYLDKCSDHTEERLAPYAGDIQVVAGTERHGKSHGMNELVARTDADIVVFTDANVMIDPAALASLGKYFRDPAVGCVCGVLRYSTGGSATAATGSLYWRLEETVKQLESDTGSVMGADGSIFAIRRRLHRPVPADIIDDMFVSFSILCDGHRVVRAPDVVAYETSIGVGAEEFRRKIRIACQAFNVHRLLSPRLRRLGWLDRYKYVSHKWLRWLSIFSLAASGALFTLWLLLAGLWPWAVALWALAGAGLLAGALGVPPFSHLLSILTAFVGTGVGVLKSLRGARFQTWTPASSIRSEPAGPAG